VTAKNHNVAAEPKFFKLTLHTPEGNKEIDCREDQYILDAAEEAGIDVPYSCRAGSCSSCAGKLLKGEIDNSEQSYLDESKREQGYILTCVGYPKADCVIETHQEDKMK
jgi:ferredoxin